MKQDPDIAHGNSDVIGTLAAGIAAGIAVGITLPTALLRAYYWPFALVFVWPKLKPTTITPPSA